MNCEEWTEEQRREYEEANIDFGFFESPTLRMIEKKVREFPDFSQAIERGIRQKIGRNDPCWCASGKKYKKCHGQTER
jgi:uncharacterized protein YecA (UPF0149 family)